MSDRTAFLEAELARVIAERDELSTGLARGSQFEAAVLAAPFGMASVSAEKGRYVFANPAYARIVGRSVEDLLASDAYDIWVECARPEDFAVEHEGAGRLAKGEIDQYQLDRPYIVKGREPHWVRSTVVASRDLGGRLSCLMIYLRDIQEQRAAELAKDQARSQLQHAQKMEALGRLAGGIAHDFNNRLLVILACIEMLRSELPAGSPLMESADMVLGSAHSAADLTRQLLAYSRHQVLKLESFDLNLAVDHMRQLLVKLMGDRVALSTNLKANTPVFFDPKQLEQVVLNLAINARDAMPRGGTLTLSTSDQTVSEGQDVGVPPGPYVCLTVADSGLGIPDDVLPRIFEPFFTTKPVGHGTGLGLSMVEGIVKQSRGAIQVRSRIGEGTTFTIYLPCGSDRPDPRAFEVVKSDLRTAPFETVLLCEDDPDVRRVLSKILRLRGYTILEAHTGKRALAIADEHGGPIQLLVTDLVMPELGGLELAIEMEKRNPGLRVLFVSGYTDQNDVLSQSLPRNARFLAKPFAPAELTRAVFALLESD